MLLGWQYAQKWFNWFIEWLNTSAQHRMSGLVVWELDAVYLVGPISFAVDIVLPISDCIALY